MLLTRQPDARYFALTNEQWILRAYQALKGAKDDHIQSDRKIIITVAYFRA